MKKIAFVLLPFLMVFFNSCELTNEPFYHFVTEGVSAGDANTLVQYNVGQYDIMADETASVSYYGHKLAVASERKANSENIGSAELPVPARVEADHWVNKNFACDFKRISSARATGTSTFSKPEGYCGESHSVGDTRGFYIYDNNDNPVRRTGTLKYQGAYCDVWFIHNSKYVLSTDVKYEEIANKFDTIYKWETEVLGGLEITSDYSNIIQSQDRVVVIIADLLEDAYDGQNGGTYGYCDYSDLYSKDSNKYSNECCSIYLDSYFYKIDRDSLISTIPHEFNHLLNFINKILCKENAEDQNSYSTWYTEMLAMVAEDMCTNLLGITDDFDEPKYNTVYYSRLPYFKEFYNLGFGNWRDETNEYLTFGDVYASYANAYAFGAFLMRNYGGFELLKELAKGPDMDEEAITNALKKLNRKESDGSTATFRSALKNFTKIIYGDSEYTLNKEQIAYSGNTSEEGLYFNSIDINKVTFPDEWVASSSTNTPSSNGQLDLGPYGFYAINYDETLGDCSVTYIKGLIEYYFCKL